VTGAPADLASAYAKCRDLNRAAGSSFYWATRLLPRPAQPHVHALYAFARYADDLVDEPATGSDPAVELGAFGDRFLGDLGRGTSTHPILAATVDTAVTYDITATVFERFLSSMTMDLTVTSYETWDDLLVYMDGSAAVIGEMMLPILAPVDHNAALAPARSLGLAFQLTNFLRDIGEDLDRGRQYLPQDDLRRFGVDLTERRRSPEFRDLMRFEIARCRELYSAAEAGIVLLPGRSCRCIAAARALYSQILVEIEDADFDRRCIRAARALYSRILVEIEDADFDVFDHRASVPRRTKLRLATTSTFTSR